MDGGVGVVVVTVLQLIAVTISIQLALAAGGNTVPPALYVFGDSILDVGNNNYLPGADVPRANTPYYGVDFPGGARPTGRWSNGYNVADLIGMYHVCVDARRSIQISRSRSSAVLHLPACSEGYGIRDEPAGVPVAHAALQPSRHQGARRSELCLWRSWDSRLHCECLMIHLILLLQKKSLDFFCKSSLLFKPSRGLLAR